MKKELVIVKIGGNIIDDNVALKKFISIVSKTKSPMILVHGGGKLATELSGTLGIKTKMISGRRVTDERTLNVAVMVYAGLINKSIVALLNGKGRPSIGLCGADHLCMISQKRNPKPIDFGFVGDVKEVDNKFIASLIKKGITPVIAPITSTKTGQLLNTNADTIASSLAVALSGLYSIRLIYCLEKNGVLQNEKVITSINVESYKILVEKGIVKDGMIPKLDNAFEAIKQGVQQVNIGHALQLNKIIHGKSGTVISK